MNVIENDWKYGWAEIPGELLKYIVYKWPLFEQVKLAVVCKAWNETINHNDFGVYDLKKYNIKPQKSNSWLEIYREEFLSVPRIIALDVSPSMKRSRMKKALKEISKIAKEYISGISFYGIDCLVFADSCYSEKLFDISEVEYYFKKGYRKGLYESGEDIGSGTSINNLFKCLVDFENKYSKPCQVVILSDFEDMTVSIKYLIESNSQLAIQCINVGKLGCIYAQKLSDDFEDYANAEALHQRELLSRKREVEKKFKASLKYRAKKLNIKKGQPIMLSGSKSAKRFRRHIGPVSPRVLRVKRKLEPDLTTCEQELSFNINVTRQSAWQPLMKKRRITLEGNFK